MGIEKQRDEISFVDLDDFLRLGGRADGDDDVAIVAPLRVVAPQEKQTKTKE